MVSFAWNSCPQGLIAGVVATALLTWPAAGADNAAVPDFSPDSRTGWIAGVPDGENPVGQEFLQPPSGPGPVTFDKAHPYLDTRAAQRAGKQPTLRVADLTNPILQPWTRERLQKVNERSLSGKVVAIPKERCWPVGVPAFLLLPATPVYFLQTPNEVWMIWMQDRQIRRVFLDVPHSANVKPSWYGESVGHYEGDALVVDTIAITTNTFVDNYQTPHTDQLHVTERIHMIDQGKTLEVNVHVEDPGAFTTPWNAIQHYRRVVDRGPLSEIVCAENNGDHFNHGLEPMPEASKPEF